MQDYCTAWQLWQLWQRCFWCGAAGDSGRFQAPWFHLSVCHVVRRTYISLQHRVVLLLGAQRLLEDGNVLLVILVLLLQSLHLRCHLHYLLLPARHLHPHVVQLEQNRFIVGVVLLIFPMSRFHQYIPCIIAFVTKDTLFALSCFLCWHRIGLLYVDTN